MTKPAPLTSLFLRHVKPPAAGQVEHTDGGCRGLRLRLSQGGSAPWVLGCRDAAGKPRRFIVGYFPDMGLKEAREAADELRPKVRKGHDPIAEAKARRMAPQAVEQEVVTLATILDAYGEAVGVTRRSWPEANRRIRDVFAAVLTRPASGLAAPELQLIVDRHPSRTSAAAAVRYARPPLKWGTKRGLVPAGIALQLDQPEGAQRVRERVLSRDEMRVILRILALVVHYGAALHWLFLTGCRLNEACSMRWRDVDLVSGLWTIPRANTKQGREHIVPLPRQARGVLRALGPQDPEHLVFANARGTRPTHWDRMTKHVQALSGTKKWHRHDIRRTVATLMGDLGTAPHIIEVALGHALRRSSDGSALGRVAATYNRSRYLREHADALQQLADELEQIAAGETQVLRLARA